MVSKGQPLGVGLSIDFARLDSDLSKVADRIDKVGANTTVKVGTSAGLASQGGGLPGGGIDPNQMALQMGQVGVALSNGMSSGIGKTNALLIAMASRINATLERLAAVSISLFTRIDASMRFPRLDTFLAKAQVGFQRLASGGKKEFSDLDFAISGGLGKIAQVAGRILKSAFAGLGKDLGATIGVPIKEAIEGLKPVIQDLGEKLKTELGGAAKAIEKALAEMPKGLKQSQTGFKDTQAAAHGLYAEIKGLTSEATKFPKFVEAIGKGMTGTRERPALRPSGLLAEPPKALPAPTPKPPPPPPPPPPPKMFGYGMGGMAPAIGDIGSFTAAVKAAIKPFADFQAKAKNVEGAIKMMGHSMGGLGQVIALPAGALWKFSGIMEQVILRGAGMGVGMIRSLNSVRAVLTSMGSVGDATYKNLVAGQNKWGTLLALMPVGVAVRAISLLGTGAGYLPSIFSAFGSVAKSVFMGMLPHAASVGQAIGGVSTQTARSSGSFVSWGMTAAKAALLTHVSISNVPVGLIYLGAKLVALPFIRFLAGKKNVDSFGTSVAAASGKTSILGGALDGVNKSVEKVSNGFKSFAGQMLAAFGVIGVVFKLVEFFKNGTKAATELNATVVRSKGVFGSSFGAVDAQAEKLARASGVAKQAQLELAAELGSTAQGAGVSEAASAGLANELTSLAVDLTAIGISFDQASEAMKTGLGGKPIALKSLGATINEDTVKAQMLKTRIEEVSTSLAGMNSQAQRASRIKIVPKGTDVVGAAMGDKAKFNADKAAKEAAATTQRTAIASRNAAKAENLAKAHEDLKAHSESIRTAGQKAIEARKAWRAGLVGGPMPKLPEPEVKPPVAKKTDQKPASSIHAVSEAIGKQSEMAARAALIMNGLSYAQGALVRSANSAAVQFQKAGGGIALFGEKIGQMLLPVLNAAAVGFNELLGNALDLVDRSGPSITEWVQQGSQNVQDFIKAVKEFGPQVVANISWAWEEAKKGPLGFVIEGTEAVWGFVKAIPEAIGIAVRNAGTLWEIAKLQFGAFAENVMRYVATIPENFGRVWAWLGRNWSSLLRDMVAGFAAFSTNLLINGANFAKALWDAIQGKGFNFKFKPLLDGVKATTEKLPELIKPDIMNVDAAVQKLRDKIAQNELKNKNKNKPKPEEEPGPEKKPPVVGEKTSEYKLGGALEAGTKEAFSALAKSQAGGGSTTDAVRQGVAVHRAHLAVAKEQLAVAKAAKAPTVGIK